MDVLYQFLAAVGFGMADLEIRVDQVEHPRGSDITGSVVLTAGRAAQRIEMLNLDLVAFQPGGQSASLSAVCVASQVTTVRHTPLTYPFTIRIPDDAELTVSSSFTGQTRNGCRLDARAHIELAMDPRASRALDVTPHREVRAAETAMRRLEFVEYTPTLIWKAPGKEGYVRHYRPPASLRDQLEEATLTMSVSAGHVSGNLILKPHEREWTERLRALVSARTMDFPLEFKPGSLLTPNGLPDPHGFLPRLEEILDEALVLPNNEKNRLLRAAASPAEETLLRPTESASRVRPEELLRPHDGAE